MRHVVVVGAGGSGLAAAVQAAEAGARVTVLESTPAPGGNTARSTGLLYGFDTHVQRRLGVADSIADALSTVRKAAEYTCDDRLVERLLRNSASAFRWLAQHGVTLKDDAMAVPPRTALVLPNGSGLTEPLRRAAEALKVELLPETRATDLLRVGGTVSGVEARSGSGTIRIEADAVILCTGGSWGPQADLETLLDRPYRRYVSLWGSPGGGRGDGFELGQRAGGTLVDLEKLSLTPQVALDAEGRHLGTMSSSVRTAGGAILLNQRLERFCDESLPYTALAWRVLHELRRRRQTWVWQLWDGTALERVPIASTYAEAFGPGLCVASTPDALAERMAVPAPRLRAALDRYNAHFAAAPPADADFGRSIAGLRPLAHPPYHAIRAGVWVTASNGGLRCDEEARVLSAAGPPIAGLYAAGNDMGGLVGSGYVAGTLLLGTVVFGRIAGANAASGRPGSAGDQEG